MQADRHPQQLQFLIPLLLEILGIKIEKDFLKHKKEKMSTTKLKLHQKKLHDRLNLPNVHIKLLQKWLIPKNNPVG
jgi:hypothetical protein